MYVQDKGYANTCAGIKSLCMIKLIDSFGLHSGFDKYGQATRGVSYCTALRE